VILCWDRAEGRLRLRLSPRHRWGFEDVAAWMAHPLDEKRIRIGMFPSTSTMKGCTEFSTLLRVFITPTNRCRSEIYGDIGDRLERYNGSPAGDSAELCSAFPMAAPTGE
jgi:hypothetical protein